MFNILIINNINRQNKMYLKKKSAKFTLKTKITGTQYLPLSKISLQAALQCV